MSTDEIIQEAQSLPPEERAAVVDSLLRTLHAPDPATDDAWLNVARARLAKLDSGDAKPVPGQDVLARLEKRFPPQ